MSPEVCDIYLKLPSCERSLRRHRKTVEKTRPPATCSCVMTLVIIINFLNKLVIIQFNTQRPVLDIVFSVTKFSAEALTT